MIKILFFIPRLSEGGAEKVLRNLVNNMDQSKFDITVQTVDDCDHKKYLSDGIHYKSINRCKTKFGKKLMNYWYRFCTEFKLTYPLYIKDDYDIEVAYLECGATKVMAASTNKNALKLAWVHCDLQKKGITDEKYGRYYSNFDKVVCVSYDVKKSFDEVFGAYADSLVLYNVIDQHEILKKSLDKVKWNCNPEQKKLLAVGRLSKEKNYAYLIETCGKLRDKGYRFHLNILGDGPEKENLIQQVNTLNLQNVIELKGFTDNPYPWINSADIILCSSVYEGLSTIVLESLILGKPVVSTPCGGMKELLGDSEYGLIADNSDNGLYKAICMILDFPELEKKYADAAKNRGYDFYKEKIISETEKFFIGELKRKN